MQAAGWLGRLLGPLRGFVKDARKPILAGEFAELQALYQVEAEESEERRLAQEAEAMRMRGG